MKGCKKCAKRTLVIDDVTGITVCSSCGIVQDFVNFQQNYTGPTGETGTYVRMGTVGAGTNYSYMERKRYEAKEMIEDTAFRLNLGDFQKIEVEKMIEKVTEGEFGLGDWFHILTGAACYIVMRLSNKVLTLNEVCSACECEIYEMGRMIGRVVDFLELELPEFDVVGLTERTIKGFSGFQELDKEKIEVMVKQGIFLVQCCIKWWLTTGRRPGQVAVAVLVFVAGVNGVKVRIEEVAKEFEVGVSTCKLRYKELLEALVEVARRLPWGDDVNVKNVVKHAPFIIKYMETKVMEDKGSLSEKNGGLKQRRSGDGRSGSFDLKKVVGESLGRDNDDGIEGDGSVVESGWGCFDIDQGLASKKRRLGDGSDLVVGGEDVGYGIDGDGSGIENGSQCYGKTQGHNYDRNSGVDELMDFKLSHEALANLYSKFTNDLATRKVVNKDEIQGYEAGLNELDFGVFNEWWSGRSELCKKLSLEQLEKKDVGFDPPPPSYIRGCQAVEERRKKIKAAKVRINSIRFPKTDVSKNETADRETSSECSGNDPCLSEIVDSVRKRKNSPKKRKNSPKKRKKMNDSINWEDFIIETLLLHKVKEEEIEKGYYKALLGLHVLGTDFD